MLEKAKRRLDRAGFGDVGFTAGEASEGFPFPDNAFNLAFLAAVIGEVPDQRACLRSLGRVLKPGGIVLVEDHSAKPGTGSTVASSLHRIEETYTVRDFEKRGFKLIGKSDLLRKPEDKLETVSYTPPGLGHTDRFLLVFRKNGG